MTQVDDALQFFYVWLEQYVNGDKEECEFLRVDVWPNIIQKVRRVI